MRKALLASGLAGLALAVGVATPASAEDTIVTVTVAATDGLTIVVPATASLPAGTPGSTITGPLGPVTVTDSRALLDATWGVTVVTSSFITGTAPATTAETIPAANVSYWSGPATAVTGNGTAPTPGQPLVANAVPIPAAVTAFSQTGAIGDNTATWNPRLIISIPAGNIAGAYTGTVTHTVL
jgi:hypothetical protein